MYAYTHTIVNLGPFNRGSIELLHEKILGSWGRKRTRQYLEGTWLGIGSAEVANRWFSQEAKICSSQGLMQREKLKDTNC